MNELRESNYLGEEARIKYLAELYEEKQYKIEPNTPEIIVEGKVPIEESKMESVFQKLKRKESLGRNKLN